MQLYRRKKATAITAIQLDLDTEGFTYQKWGGTQRCKRGDWLVNNQGDVYTVDRESFERTYCMVSPGVYIKDTPMWAKQAEAPGTIQTKEGSTAYQAGDSVRPISAQDSARNTSEAETIPGKTSRPQ